MFTRREAGEGAVDRLTNPAQSLPALPPLRLALEAAELAVLQEAYANTETAPFADVLLPATSWGEKDGTVTNSERRISRVRAAVPKPFEARHDWEIACDFARRLERGLRPNQRSLFAFTTAESIWNEHRETTRGRDLDITGLSYAILDDRGPTLLYPSGAGRAPLGSTRTDPSSRPIAAQDSMPTPQGVAEPVDARIRFASPRDGCATTARHEPTGTVAEPLRPRSRAAPRHERGARRAAHQGGPVRVESRRGAIHVIVESDDDALGPVVYPS